MLSFNLVTFLVFQGCYEKVEEWLEDNKHLLGTIGMCILVVQVRLCVLVCLPSLSMSNAVVIMSVPVLYDSAETVKHMYGDPQTAQKKTGEMLIRAR